MTAPEKSTTEAAIEIKTTEALTPQSQYALWFFYDKDQSCFVELYDDRPSRQPEFYVKGKNHCILLELFRRRRSSQEERVLVGEATIPISFLLHATESNMIVEIMRGGVELVATVLVKIEKLDRRGRSLSQKTLKKSHPSDALSSSGASVKASSSDVGAVTTSSFSVVGRSDSPTGKHRAIITVIISTNVALLEEEISSSASSSTPYKTDFLQKFSLSGSPITIVKSQYGGPIALSRDSTPPNDNNSNGISIDEDTEEATMHEHTTAMMTGKLSKSLLEPSSTSLLEQSSTSYALPIPSPSSTASIMAPILHQPSSSKIHPLSQINELVPPASSDEHENDGGQLSHPSSSAPSIPSRLALPVKVKGLVSLEIVAAQNLPRERRLFRVHYTNNPFVVVSFSRQTFRTRVIKRTINPVWKERCFFTIKESEQNYSIVFSIYDYDKLGFNVCTGTSALLASNLLEHPNEIQKLALPLKFSSSHEANSLTNDAYLLVKACFISYDVLRKNFWEILAKQYDHDDNGKLNRVEFSTMLASIGSTLSDDTLDTIIHGLDVDLDGEIAIENIVNSLEALTVKSSLPEHAEENIVLIRTCPVCNRHFIKKGEDIDVITHLAVCAAQDAGRLDRLMLGGFLTEDYASRKWFMRLISFMGFGGYRLGRNNGNILVQDRRTGKLLEERMPTYIRLGIRWLHQYRAPKRAVDSNMVRQIFHTLTIKQGKKFDDPSSVRNIPDFIRYHNLNMDEIADPIPSFRSFNEFFYRKLKPGARTLASEDPNVAISPADCRLNVFESVGEATRLWIKGANFSLASLLKDDNLAAYYEGGSLVICRLAPQDYHRFHSPVDGQLTFYYHLPGTYFTVNPMAVRQNIDVFTENSRTVCLLDSPCFGKVVLVAIGAMMVGSIVITATGGRPIRRLDEIGYFAFGGSTIVLLFPAGRLEFDSDLLRNSQEQLETLVQVGDSIGQALRQQERVSSTTL